LSQDVAKCSGSANHLLEHGGSQDILAQGNRFVAHPLLGALAVIDVSARGIPADDPAVRVDQRVVPYQKPAILPVFAERSLLVLERHTFRESLAAFVAQPRDIFRVEDELAKSFRAYVLQIEPAVIQSEAVRVEGPAIGV